MKAQLENRLSMYVSVDGVLAQNENAWNSNPAFVTSVAAFRSGVSAINGLVQATSISTKGTTQSKQSARDEMSRVTLEYTGMLCAFAAKTGNQELMARTDVSKSDLNRLRDTEVGNTCQALHDLVAGHLADLADAQVADGDMDTWQDKIDAYQNCVGSPRQQLSAKSASFRGLETAFGKADLVLEMELDQRMRKFEGVAPGFFEAYMAARRVVDNVGGRNGKDDNGDETPTPTPGQ